MFYSHLLLSKKGGLGTVWVAAHCHKRLKKNQVKQTDIPSSVEKILLEEVPVVTYRILAYLLLGVVRIYSKKVEYLFHDCHDVLSKLHEFKITKGKCEVKRDSRTPNRSITRPKRFELDAFDLEASEDHKLGGANVKSPEELMLADGQIKDGSLDGLLCKGKILYSEAYSTASTPPRDVLSPHTTETDSFGSPFHNVSDSGTSLDTFHGALFPLDDHLDPMVLDDAEKQQISDSVMVPLHNVIDTMASNEKLHESRPSFQVAEPDDLTVLVNKEQPVDDMNSLEVINTESKERQRNHTVSITVDVTPGPKFPVKMRAFILLVTISFSEADVGSPEVGHVKTPAPKERGKILKKRKVLFDETTVLANKVFKGWIRDPSNLTCKRRKVPHTILHAWRTRKLCTMPQSILEPLIPYVSINLDSFERKREIHKEADEPAELPSIQDVAKSPVTFSSHERTPLAPATPVTHLTPLRSTETREVSDIFEPKSSLEILENSPASGGEKELEMLLRDELTKGIEHIQLSCSYKEADSSGEDGSGKNKYATRTRMTGRYLYKNFLNKKSKRQDEVLKLSELLSRKTKKGCARLFYEILVLRHYFARRRKILNKEIKIQKVSVSEYSLMNNVTEQENDVEEDIGVGVGHLDDVEHIITQSDELNIGVGVGHLDDVEHIITQSDELNIGVGVGHLDDVEHIITQSDELNIGVGVGHLDDVEHILTQPDELNIGVGVGHLDDVEHILTQPDELNIGVGVGHLDDVEHILTQPDELNIGVGVGHLDDVEHILTQPDELNIGVGVGHLDDVEHILTQPDELNIGVGVGHLDDVEHIVTQPDELNVLKMENCIDVRQESPYGDIFIHESSKLKQISEP
ncbi:sister chromatid cohesion 1 protein 2 [Dorcoceras hygrometricum]|nr:sister chromatid cohesion 1 protein 2 [Dorcoceras hygrometricum]